MIVALVSRRTASRRSRRATFAGQLLVATPEMKDPRFVRIGYLHREHDHEGTMGLVINRPLAQAPVEEVIAGSGIHEKGGTREITIHYGGPVSPRQGFVLA